MADSGRPRRPRSAIGATCRSAHTPASVTGMAAAELRSGFLETGCRRWVLVVPTYLIAEIAGRLRLSFEFLAKEFHGRSEGLGSGVVCRGKPAIAKTGDAAQAGLRAPASDPQRDAAALPRRGQPGQRRGVVGTAVRGRPRLEQGFEQPGRLVEMLPPLLERHSHRLVVSLGRPRANAGDDAAAANPHSRAASTVSASWRYENPSPPKSINGK
jgi:hypothetical protein